MVKLIESKEDLESWEDYKDFLSVQLKTLEGTGLPIHVTKEKFEFKIDGKPWKGHAVMAGVKGDACARKLQKAGVMFREGTFGKSGKELKLDALDPKLAKEAAKTIRKLRLPYKLTGVVEDESDADAAESEPAAAAAQAPSGAPAAAAGDLKKQAEKIAKAVEVWNKTEQVATKELRKLQKMLLDLDDPRTKPVIQGLEGILTQIDKVDDEANAVAAAAGSGDARAFGTARTALIGKLNGILSHVQQDPLIRQADTNPLTPIKIGETFTKSLNQLIKAI